MIYNVNAGGCRHIYNYVKQKIEKTALIPNHRFGESLDLVTTRMLPEVSSPVLNTLAASRLAVIMATNITEATDSK